jgi:cytochrome c oxidase assembly protein subunit 15
VAQIILGAIVVKTHLVPSAVSAHFLVSMVLVWNAVVLHVHAAEGTEPPRWLVAPSVRRLTWLAVGLLAVVLFLGTLVTGSGPHSGDLESGEVERLGYDISTITRVHSVAVWTLVAATLAAVVAAAVTRAPVGVRRWGVALLVAEMAQGGVGYLQYANGVPVELVALHVLGAAVVWIAAIRFALCQRTRGTEGAAAAPVAAGADTPRPVGVVG